MKLEPPLYMLQPYPQGLFAPFMWYLTRYKCLLASFWPYAYKNRFQMIASPFDVTSCFVLLTLDVESASDKETYCWLTFMLQT
jgi:hypothetical protein